MTNLLISEKETTKNIQSANCAEALVDTLSELGVDSIFGYPGAAVLSIYNELSKNQNIRHYLVRHEQAAVHAAEGYARVSGKAGVVLVTSGPGFTNTITGIANAYADSTPLVVLAGDVPSNETNSKVFQKVDIISMTKTCSKKSYLLTSKDDIKQVLKEAFEVATTGEKGPVVVAMPRNILEAKYAPKVTKELHKKKKTQLKESDFEKVIKLINASTSPLILLGGGSVEAVESIKKFVSHTKIPVVSTLMGIGAFPSENMQYLGMIGMNGTYSANAALNNADFILALGVSFSDRSTCKNADFAQHAKIVSVNLKNISKNFEFELISDTKSFMDGLCAYTSEVRDFSEWNSKLNIFKEENVKKETNSA